jgi:hypothetical protein
MNHPITTSENHLLQHPKIPLQHGETTKGVQNSKGDEFEVQAASAPHPSPSSLLEGGGNRTPELAGTLATATSLRSKGGGGGGEEGGGLRSREGLANLVGAVVIVLIFGGEERELGRSGAAVEVTEGE